MRKGYRMMDDLFPRIVKSIDTLIEDEEGNIPGKKLLFLGTMVLVLGSMFSIDALAKHGSHKSHSSHSSHSSGSHGSGAYHESHVSHVSHQSHVSGDGHSSHSSAADHSNHASHSSYEHDSHENHASHASEHSNHASHSNHSNHASHTSHSNTAAHSNSKYSVEGDVKYAPAASSIPSVDNIPNANPIEALNIEINGTMNTSNTPEVLIAPNLPAPMSVLGTEGEYEELIIPKTETVE